MLIKDYRQWVVLWCSATDKAELKRQTDPDSEYRDVDALFKLQIDKVWLSGGERSKPHVCVVLCAVHAVNQVSHNTRVTTVLTKNIYVARLCTYLNTHRDTHTITCCPRTLSITTNIYRVAQNKIPHQTLRNNFTTSCQILKILQAI